jgi:hypothetical protein
MPDLLGDHTSRPLGSIQRRATDSFTACSIKDFSGGPRFWREQISNERHCFVQGPAL